MTSIKRESLRPFEGQLVHFSGFMENWRTGDGIVDACLQKLKVRPWDGQSPIHECGPAIKVDHAWIRVASENWMPRPERLSIYEAVGRVGWYRRSDGTVDLGLTTLPSLCLERFLKQFYEKQLKKRTWGDRLSQLDGFLEAADDHQKAGVGSIYSHAKSVSEGLQIIRDVRDRLRRDQAKNIAALTTSVGWGCNGLDAGLDFKHQPGRAPAGFA